MTSSHVSRRSALASLTLALSACATARPPRQPIREDSFVNIGGIEQWVTIRGSDQNNPVLLFLHAGPGSPMTPYAEAMFAGWEADFTLVQWDQRGAGRTFGRNPPTGAVSIQRMVDDGIELSEFLVRRLNARQITLIGVSWGSILGVYMARQRPDLFRAYIGQSQVVTLDAERNHDAEPYALSLAAARAANDQRAVNILTQVAPPWRFGLQWRGYHGLAAPYENARITAAPAPMTVSPEYSTADELAHNQAGQNFSLSNFFGDRDRGPLFDVDLSSLGPEFPIPIVIMMGEHDAITSPATARAFLENLRAPRKQFHLIPGAGHGPSAPQLALTHRILLQDARPLAAP